MHKRWQGMPIPCQKYEMSVKLPYGKPKTDRHDGRLFLTDENLDRGALLLMSASRRLETRLRKVAEAEGISSPQLSVLLEIKSTPGLNVADLRNRLGGTTPTIARLLGELDKKGLITRPRNVSDGRQRALGLSDTGDHIIERALASLRRDLTQVYRNAGEPSVSGALELLGSIADLPAGEQDT